MVTVAVSVAVSGISIGSVVSVPTVVWFLGWRCWWMMV